MRLSMISPVAQCRPYSCAFREGPWHRTMLQTVVALRVLSSAHLRSRWDTKVHFMLSSQQKILKHIIIHFRLKLYGVLSACIFQMEV